ncbi:MAG: glycosyltransferase, partial [Magnetococcales bacterium]|nr:glycosyltransferase [Magnetococcales bacterium]
MPAIRYGGPIRSSHGLCRALVSQGHEVHVYTTNVHGTEDMDVAMDKPVDVDGVKVHYFPSHGIGRRIYRAPKMQQALNKEISSFDLLHIHALYNWPSWMAGRVAHRVGVPYLVSPRGVLVRDLIKRKSRFIKSA